LPAEQFNELLKLRGEVGNLRKQLTEARNIPAQTASHPAQTDASEHPDTQPTLVARRRMTTARDLAAAAMIGYAQRHQNQFPTNWAQVAPYFDEWERNGLNPGDVMPDTAADFGQVTNEFDLVYQGSTTNLFGTTNYGDIIVVREKEPWQAPDGKWVKTYGFADGHAELHAEPSGNFDDYERQHTVSPPNQ
jgi:hypothetical protein